MNLEGQRVKHPKYGEGTVLTKHGGSFALLVRFDKGMTFYVRRDECRFLRTELSTEHLETILPTPEESMPGKREIRAACFLDTFRLGIVPSEVSSFTFGRQKELEIVAEWVEKTNTYPLFLVGDYGSGKSHLLQCIREKYLRKGWAVATCQLDPNECTLHRPKRVYNRIVKSIRYLDGGKEAGFRDLLRNFAGQNNDGLGHDYIDFVLRVCRRYDDPPADIWNWIEGSGPTACYFGLPLYDDAPSTNIYCSILGSFADMSRRYGLRGLLIILDEAEQIRGSWYHKPQFLKGIDFLGGLALTTAASDLLIEKPTFNENPPPTFIGPKSGLPYSARKQIPYAISSTSSLKIAFAFTEIQFLYGYGEKLGHPQVIRLNPLDDKAKEEILAALYDIYGIAYSEFTYDNIDELVRDTLRTKKYSESTRTLIKVFIEALDILRYHKVESHRSFFS